MFYTIYRITNLINGKFYIGKHQTKDLNDGYMGSGRLLKQAVKKYGLDNFHKEILHVVQTEKEMDILEKILVVPDQEINYNLCEGGKGGWSYVNRNGLQVSNKQKEIARKIGKKMMIAYNKTLSDQDRSRKAKQASYTKINNGISIIHKGNKICVGRKYSSETLEKMSAKQKGNLNSQYGTCWITNGQVNKKIKKDELDNWLELGYYKGRM